MLMNFRLRRGQLAIILSLILPTLLGAMALGTDVGVFYFNWIKLQKGADAAVLAGANFLPSNPGLAVSTTEQYAQYNGIQQSEMSTPTLAANDMSISLNASRTVPYYFARVLGLGSGVVSVTATAGVQGADKASGLVPIGIQYGTPLTTYQSVILKLAPEQGSVGPGNWEPLAMGYTTNQDPGGDNFRTNLQYGYSPTISINDEIYTETGNLVGPTKDGINARLDGASSSDPSGTSTDHTLSDPRMIEIPIVDFADINGNSQVPVLGFAEFWITSVDGNGNINGEFITQVAAGNQPGSDPSSSGSLPLVAVLIK